MKVKGSYVQKVERIGKGKGTYELRERARKRGRGKGRKDGNGGGGTGVGKDKRRCTKWRAAEDLGDELGSQRDFGSRHAAPAVAGAKLRKGGGRFYTVRRKLL